LKKIFLLLLAAIFAVGLVACDEESASSEEADQEGQEAEAAEDDATEKEEETLTIGDTAEVDGIKFTLKGVSTTDERNEFEETNPSKVVKIEYEVENNSEEEIPVGGDLQVYDGTGNQVDSYALDNTMGSLQPGKKMQGVEHFGIEEGPIEVYFQPLISFEDPAIFTADIE